MNKEYIKDMVRELARDEVIVDDEDLKALYLTDEYNLMVKKMAKNWDENNTDCRNWLNEEEFIDELKGFNPEEEVKEIDELTTDEIEELISLFNKEYQEYSQEFYKEKLEELEEEELEDEEWDEDEDEDEDEEEWEDEE